MSTKDNHINYIEFSASDLEKTKAFYAEAFNWSFTAYGPEYASFSGAGIDGGFGVTKSTIANGVLIVLYHADLNLAKANVINAGGSISKDIFEFPGGRRFHFKDPSGNELAVWSE